MNDKTRQPQHGGARTGAGRKSRYTVSTDRRVVNLPAAYIAAIEKQHGSLTAALESLAIAAQPELAALKRRTE